MVRAWIKRVGGGLVIVETEYGQKAVVPDVSLCDLLARYKLEVVNEDIKCERIEVRVGGSERFIEEDS